MMDVGDATEDAMEECARACAEACADLAALEVLLADAVADANAPAADLRALSAWADRRVALQDAATSLERRAMSALARAGCASSPSGVSLAALDQIAPDATDAVRSRLAGVHARLGELRDVEQRRNALVGRCMDIVRSYLGAIDPPMRAYGRNGAPAAAGAPGAPGASAAVRSSVRRSA
jgi:hypothetical protein